jgi:hypothetical protein
MSVQLIEVQARWAYSEIIAATLSHFYDGGDGIGDLRMKRAGGVPLEELSEDERYHLAILSVSVRRGLLMYQIGTEPFDIVEIDREALAKVFVARNVWEQERFAAFSEYIKTPSENRDDARNVELIGESYRRPTDPVTIGRWYRMPILIDGYHRAARFWKFCASGTLLAYVPRVFTHDGGNALGCIKTPAVSCHGP